MQRVRIQTLVPVDRLLKPTPAFTRDAAGRITEIVYPYTSIKITYTVVWAAPSGADIVSVSQLVEDLP